MTDHAAEVARGDRFTFGENWSSFLEVLNDQRITQAEASIREMLGRDSLKGCHLLDLGSGSGLFSLAARRLGARVHSFDYDPHSVACTQELRRRYFPDDPDWQVESGSILDPAYVQGLSRYDIVYSWGVLHHTGAMWTALENAGRLVRPGGELFLSIYNDAGWRSRLWLGLKWAYNKLPAALRFLILWPAVARLWGPTTIREWLKGTRRYPWLSEQQGRGMSPWYDMVDWVGGYPYEVATPKQIVNFFQARGFKQVRLLDRSGGLGCNEFVLKRREA